MRWEGQVIDGWKIEKEIARGGMGIVCLASQVSIQRKVALKLMITTNYSESERKRFLQEAQFTAQLSHPNIVPLIHFGMFKDYPYIVMDYIEGCSLEDILDEENSSYSLEQKLKIFLDICKALALSHEKGIIHRDLKPANILVTEENRGILTDFGLAKKMDAKSRLTQTGDIVGTIFYMSPEQVNGERELRATSDIFSLGVILYQIVYAQRPFRGGNISEVFKQITLEEPRWPRCNRESQIQKNWRAICAKAMDKDPVYRYQSVRELHEDIESNLQNKKVFAVDRSSRQRKLFWGFIATIYVAILCLVWFLYQSWKAEPTVDFLSQGKVAYEQKRYEDAEKLLSRFLQKSPSNIEALYLRGKILQKQQNFADLKFAWRRLYFASSMKDKDVLQKIAETAYQLGMDEEAKLFAEKLIVIEDSLQLREQLVEVYLRENNLLKLRENVLLLPQKNILRSIAQMYIAWQDHDWDELNSLAVGKLPVKAVDIGIYDFFRVMTKLVQVSQDLNQFAWLLPDKAEKHFVTEKVKWNLDECLSQLKIAAKNLQTTEQSPWQSFWSRQINTYAMSVQIDLAQLSSEEILKDFLPALETLTVRNQEWLVQSVVRFCIKDGGSDAARKFLETYTRKFPWSASLRYLQAVTLFQQRNSTNAFRELKYAALLDPQNPNTLADAIPLATEYLNHETFMTLLYFLTDNLGLAPLYRDFVRQDYEELKKNYQLFVPRSKAHRNVLWKVIVASSSTNSMELAMKSWVYSFVNLEELEADFSVKQQELSKSEQQQVYDIYFRYFLGRLRHQVATHLIQYYATQDQNSFTTILNLQSKHENILWEMLSSKSPMLAYLAGYFLAETREASNLKKMKDIASSSHFPENILAFSIIAEKKVFPVTLMEEKQLLEMLSSLPELYCVLLALNLPANNYSKVKEALFQHSSHKVQLAVAYNTLFCVSEKIKKPSPSYQAAQKVAYSYFRNSSDFEIQALALRVLWCLGRKPFAFDYDNRERGPKFIQAVWDQYKDTLVVAMNSKSLELRSSVYSIILQNFPAFKTLYSSPNLATKKLRDCVLRDIIAGSRQEQYWASNVLPIISSSQELFEFYTRRDIPSVFRTSMTLASLRMERGKAAEQFRKVTSSLLNDSFGNEVDRRFMRVIYLSMSSIPTMLQSKGKSKVLSNLYRVVLKKIRNKHMQDSFFYDTLIVSMLWNGEVKDLKFLHKFLDSEDVRSGISVVAMGAILSRQSPQKIKSFMKQYQKWSKEKKKLFAKGLYMGTRIKIMAATSTLDMNLFYDQEKFYDEILEVGDKNYLQKLSLAVKWWPRSSVFLEMIILSKKFGRTKDIPGYLQRAKYFAKAEKDLLSLTSCFILEGKQATNQEQAIKMFDLAVETNRFPKSLWENYGNYFFEIGLYNKAIEKYWQGYLYYYDTPFGRDFWLKVLHAKSKVGVGEVEQYYEEFKNFKYYMQMRYIIAKVPALAQHPLFTKK